MWTLVSSGQERNVGSGKVRLLCELCEDDKVNRVFCSQSKCEKPKGELNPPDEVTHAGS